MLRCIDTFLICFMVDSEHSQEIRTLEEDQGKAPRPENDACHKDEPHQKSQPLRFRAKAVAISSRKALPAAASMEAIETAPIEKNCSQTAPHATHPMYRKGIHRVINVESKQQVCKCLIQQAANRGCSNRRESGDISASCGDGDDARQYAIAKSSHIILSHGDPFDADDSKAACCSCQNCIHGNLCG
eukprot:Skav206139  [mRNA]  locus=scaffold471:47958:52377:- [translate_table: standard]